MLEFRNDGEVVRRVLIAVGGGFRDSVGFTAGEQGARVVRAGFFDGGKQVFLELVGRRDCLAASNLFLLSA